MKYLKLFGTTSEYETYINGSDKVLPNVSFCEDERGMHYNPCPPPKNVIIYEATAKLTETTASGEGGFHINVFSGASGQLTMENHTFENGVGTVTFNGDITSIGNYAFYKCSGLSSVTIPNSVTSIGEGAFSSCSSLTSITIPNSVTSIGEFAFSDCSSLTSVTIPNSLTSIGRAAFINCSSLTSVTWNAKNCTDFSSESYSPFYYNGTRIAEFKFGEEVETIPRYLCFSMTRLTTITIPNSVTSIGERAFYDCDGLTSITIPNSVTSIGYGAFDFCSGLTSVSIPNSVTSIGSGAFRGCSGLTTIAVQDGNTKYDSRNNCNAIIETVTNTLVQGCNNTIIPNSVTSIGEDAFEEYSSLTSIIIPNSVTSIGESAFSSCSSLTSITIPNSVTSIGYGAFSECSGLTSITIPNSITNIEEDAFFGCENVGDIYCYPNPNDLEIGDGWDDDFKEDKQTVCHVKSEYLSQYEEHFGEANVTFAGDLV